MEYKNVVAGVFLKRPNRFIAHVLINGQEEVAHVRNTGRCRELLIPGVTVYLEPSENPNRKTKFTLIAVEKNDLLINIDSLAPNRALGEALLQRKPQGFPAGVTQVAAEHSHGDSRLDFALWQGESLTLVEAKGVTLEKDGVVMFPDAPTIRGVKHIDELIGAKKNNIGAIICFVITLENPKYFTPNRDTHPAFADALLRAESAGVDILAFDCIVKPDTVVINNPVEVVL